MTVKELLLLTEKRFKNCKISSPKAEAEILVSFFFKFKDPTEMFLKYGFQISDVRLQSFFELSDKRATRFPLQYITNNQKFLDLDLYVDNTVLIPRPETEVLVKCCLEYIKNNKIKSILDIGTGSGAIALAIKRMFPKLNVVGSDISKEAIKIAKRNSVNNGISGVKFVESDVFDKVKKPIFRKYDLIVSNPPYIKSDEFDSLEPELKYEPLKALDGGPHGTKYYKQIIEDADKYLSKRGFIIFEIGENLTDLIFKLVTKSEYLKFEGVITDLNNKDRVVVIKRK